MIDRIRTRESFLRLRRDGQRVRVDPLWCTYLPDPEISPPQVAFAIGRAVGNAVTRNRLRRRLREILRASPPPPGLMLIGADRRAIELTFDQLTASTQRLTRSLPTTVSS